MTESRVSLLPFMAKARRKAECLTTWARLMRVLAGRRPDRPVPPMVGTAAIGTVVHLPATAIEEGRDLSSMSGVPAVSAYRLLSA